MVYSLFCRHNSFSNSEVSLELKTSDDAFRDVVPSPLYPSSSQPICPPNTSPSPFHQGCLINPPLTPLSTPVILPSSSSSPLRHCAASVFKFDKPNSSPLLEATGQRQTPPPLPPKSNQLSEHLSDESNHKPRAISVQRFSGHTVFLSRRTSLSSLDHFKTGKSWTQIHVSTTQCSY